MTFIPPRPTGDDEEARGLQALWDNAWGPNRKLHRDTPDTKWDYNSDGTDTLNINFPNRAADPQKFHPFKIYQPNKSSLPPTGLIFDSSGNPSSIAIDQTVPTNLPTTVNPKTDWWRFWAVRNGIVEYRQIYETILQFDINQNWPVTNNFAVQIDIANFNRDNGCGGTDGACPFFGNIYIETGLEYDDPTTSIQGQSEADGFSSVLIIDGDVDSNGIIDFFIYINIYQPPTPGDYNITIAGQRNYSNSPLQIRSPNIIPVGFVFSNALSEVSAAENPYNMIVEQILFGHAVNRYTPGALINRGDWTADSLSGQYFYPNDIVTNGSFSSGGHTFAPLYRRISYGQSASLADGYWQTLIA